MTCYVYGIVAADHPAAFGTLAGVGETPAALRLVPAGQLAVVISDAPETLRAKRRDLLAHQEVLQTLCAQAATLPMRFGLLADNDDTAVNEVAQNEDVYSRLLAELDGRVEVNVKAAYDEDEILRQLLLDDTALRETNERLQHHGGSTEERVAFGQEVATALDARRQADGDLILAELRPLAVSESTGPELDGTVVNTSFLVERDELEAFDAIAATVRSHWHPIADVKARGPLPPYSFTDSASVR